MSERNEKRRRRLLKEQPLSRLLPNMITIAGLCCGLSAIRFAMTERWEISVGFIIVAALIDGMDGRVARMLGATSTFGAQLDSLSDFLCFGVAPALVIYMWQLHEIRGIGWGAVLFFAVCTALRLARFNTALFDEPEPWEKKFFTGVPAPGGGLLCLLPLVISIQLENAEYDLPPAFSAIHTLLIGILMASRIPTFSIKHIRIKHERIPQVMIVGTLLLAIFIIEPWIFLIGLGAFYLGSILFSVRLWRKYKRASDLAKR